MDDAIPRDRKDGQASAAKLAAHSYAQRGWSVIPVPLRSKNPGFDGWQRLRLTTETIHTHFNGQPQNLGVLLGEPSGWIVDVDLDHPRAVELAPQFLPATPAIFGRAGKSRSHWLYRATRPVATKKHKSKSAGMIVELRSTGSQTVFPPSTHESGEAIAWVDETAEPTPISSSSASNGWQTPCLWNWVRNDRPLTSINVSRNRHPNRDYPAPSSPWTRHPAASLP